MWRSRIADRYNAPRSVSRVRSGFRDDCVGGVCGNNYRNVVCPLALRSLKTLRALNWGRAKTCGNNHEIADSSLRNAPRSVSRATTSFRDDCRGGLSVFCCPLLSLVVYCCSCCRFLLFVPSPARNPLVVLCCLLLFRLSFSSFVPSPARNYSCILATPS